MVDCAVLSTRVPVMRSRTYCGLHCMTIRPLHLDINLEVVYVNFCSFILQKAIHDCMTEDPKLAVELHRLDMSTTFGFRLITAQ